MDAAPSPSGHRVAVALLVVLTTLAGCSLVRPPPPVVAGAAAVPLLDTHWRLVQLGGELMDNPAGERDAHIVLVSANNAVTGDSGCNRLFGHYALENDMLKFDGVGGTKMFCEARMALEQSLTNALMSTLSWKITGRALELRDETGKAVATFEAADAAR
jgi:heat shock protein HslJ